MSLSTSNRDNRHKEYYIKPEVKVTSAPITLTISPERRINGAIVSNSVEALEFECLMLNMKNDRKATGQGCDVRLHTRTSVVIAKM